MNLPARGAIILVCLAFSSISTVGAAPNLSTTGPAAAQHSAPAPQTSSKCDPIKIAAAKQACSDAEKAYWAEDYKLSQSFLKKAVAIAPMDGTAHALLGRISLRMNDSLRAERELRQARTLGAPDRLVLQPLFQAMVGRREERRLLQEFPEPAMGAKGDVAADILAGRALALASLDRVREAAAQMDRSLALRRDLNGLLEREAIAVQQNDLALAEALTEEALKLNPRSGLALLAKLQLLQRKNEAKNALALSDRILQIYPHNVDARMMRFEIFLASKQYLNANMEADAILARSPGVAIGLYYKALIRARQNDVAGAWKIAQGLPSQFTQSQIAYASEVAQMASANGKFDSAATILGGALTNFPDALDLRLRLAQIRLDQNSVQAALSILTPVKDSPDPRVKSLMAKIKFKLDMLR